jgi:hypothetical protein
MGWNIGTVEASYQIFRNRLMLAWEYWYYTPNSQIDLMLAYNIAKVEAFYQKFPKRLMLPNWDAVGTGQNADTNFFLFLILVVLIISSNF